MQTPNPGFRLGTRLPGPLLKSCAEVVRRCPTGALQYLLTAGPAEVPDAATRVDIIQNGPLFVRGDLTIMSASGLMEFGPVRETRAALCRCGASSHAPYCDGTHRNIGFQAAGTAPTDHG